MKEEKQTNKHILSEKIGTTCSPKSCGFTFQCPCEAGTNMRSLSKEYIDRFCMKSFILCINTYLKIIFKIVHVILKFTLIKDIKHNIATVEIVSTKYSLTCYVGTSINQNLYQILCVCVYQ